MRRHSKKKHAVLLLLLLAGGFYFVRHSVNTEKLEEPASVNLTWKGERMVSMESWVEQGDYLPLNVTYQVLAGVPSTQSRYLCIGLSSVKRKKGSYLIPTLVSLFSQSSHEERSSMVVVVLLADFDVSWRKTTVTKLKSEFSSALEQGHLLVIHVTEEWYPPTAGLKRNYNDSPERVSYRSKQNLDYAFLVHYSSGLSRYYLQLEDDVSSAKNFPTTIKKCIEEQEAKKTTWAMLEFSSLGYIGKLYQSAHLPLLARFLFLFYQEMPCDWLMSHFRLLLTQKEPILFKPSLFQHIGTFSSFQGTYNKLKDKDFEASVYSNPPAEVFSDMSTYKKHFPKLAWDAGEGFFWGSSPEKGNYLTVVFTDPRVVTGITVETGSEGKDILASAQVEIGHNVITTTKEKKTCKDFHILGFIENGWFAMQEVDKNYTSASSCLRIQVTAGQKEWVIIRKIRIST
ncbi:alpha-1,3-mannosyl-glycoprotein 4-beta-N-acetylglucosaminyltransferase C-like [Phycodurus eques]|uniref:alpha-1,3-mannosyl-glycoprotein 4-beta-N-acetylglucosaminyltransferase C-like n=1 Tax=Phycodurus eques TaxID=693459 RepID=UPI002ACD6FCA|nr:alpha-1,3-mannosyl-glycoprotein 4-beta-N-acetylglucosaminyltransferase C-like [Phycodurus eques]XP_061543816.1 alpha-1,3-mannosyl-glycoprotein 4-beta-N-acetylglucosaminyltransferase C-like [Phycodurus eques]